MIATGFDRGVAAKQAAASAAETPVDLQNYTAWRNESVEKVAVAGGGGSGAGITRLSVTRRPVLEMPVATTAAAADPAIDTLIPRAEFEPLDVPAFLRRQNEA